MKKCFKRTDVAAQRATCGLFFFFRQAYEKKGEDLFRPN